MKKSLLIATLILLSGCASVGPHHLASNSSQNDCYNFNAAGGIGWKAIYATKGQNKSNC